MNENAKKAGLVVIVIVALVGAVFGAMRFFGTEKMEVQNVNAMPPGYKSEKERALEAQNAGQPAPEPGKGGGEERDLGGDLKGGG